MVSRLSDDRIAHTRFHALADHLSPGDVLVVNTSGTINAALPAQRADGTPVELHLSTRLPADLWIVEMRIPDGVSSKPFCEVRPGETFTLPGGGLATLHTPYAQADRSLAPGAACIRLWIATLRLPEDLATYLQAHGFPIRYGYIRESWPLSYYQTVFATEPGSAEMPSAGRAFTAELVTRLVARGVRVAPLLLHTGVSSQEDHEPPYEEFYRVSPETAELVNQARQAGRRVVAVGTTAVRAMESVTDARGISHPGEGWTRLVVTPERGLRSVNGILTGLHEPKATHLAMLAALAGEDHLRKAYDAALAERYLWHEFGDLHLIVP
jgi:S-adenosylmethionine:tRNA ribosyltransferase-isomerase